ncbi:MAG: sortase [Candidatus Saccharimonadales bacterium]
MSAEHIGTYTFTGSKINPPGNEPVWLDNVGSMVGSKMQTAWIAGHTQEGNPAMPFSQLELLQPGDLIEISTEGGVVFAAVDPGGVIKPTKGRVRVTNDDNVIKLISCTPDGSANVIVTAHLIES